MKCTVAIIILFTSILVSGCSDDDYYNRKSRFSGDIENKQLIEKLKKENIRFKVFDDGNIGYNSKNEEKVKLLTMEVVNTLAGKQVPQYKPEPMVWFAPPYHSQLVARFKEKNVSFSIKTIDDKEHIVWEEKDDDMARAIVDQFVMDLESGKSPSNQAPHTDSLPLAGER